MQGLLDTWENAFWHFVHIQVNKILEFNLVELKKLAHMSTYSVQYAEPLVLTK